MALILFQLSDILNRSSEDTALILFTARDNFGEFGYSIIDGFTATTFDFFMVIATLTMPFLAPDEGTVGGGFSVAVDWRGSLVVDGLRDCVAEGGLERGGDAWGCAVS
jgi:hypothetical protein